MRETLPLFVIALIPLIAIGVAKVAVLVLLFLVR